MKVVIKKSLWPSQHSELLIEMATESMVANGYVDVESLGIRFRRSPSSIKCKMDSLGIHYKLKPTLATPNYEYTRKSDMRLLPKHSKGDLRDKNVDYQNSWKL